MDTDTVESYTYYCNYKGVPYIIGYSRIKTAVYSDQTNPNLASVIIQTTTNPIDVWVSDWLGIKSYFDSVTISQKGIYYTAVIPTTTLHAYMYY